MVYARNPTIVLGHSRYSDILCTFDKIEAMNPEEQIPQLCAVIAIEADSEELRSLLRQLEFALTEYGLNVQNRAIFLSNPPGTSP